MAKTIDIKCGIYDTEYTLTEHRDGSISVKAPYIKWVNNTGNLAFQTVNIPNGHVAEQIKLAFTADSLFLPGYECSTVGDAITW